MEQRNMVHWVFLPRIALDMAASIRQKRNQKRKIKSKISIYGKEYYLRFKLVVERMERKSPTLTKPLG